MGDNKISEAVEAIAARFRSGNSVPVERASVPRNEWESLIAAFAHLQGEAVPVFFVEDDFGLWNMTTESNYSFWEKSGSKKVMKLYPRPHPQPAELSEVSGDSGEVPPEEVTLKQVIDGYVATYGSLRQAAELLCIDPAYLSRLAGCRKANPSDEVLGKLGLERRVVYTRKVHDYQPTKLHQRTKCA